MIFYFFPSSRLMILFFSDNLDNLKYYSIISYNLWIIYYLASQEYWYYPNCTKGFWPEYLSHETNSAKASTYQPSCQSILYNQNHFISYFLYQKFIYSYINLVNWSFCLLLYNTLLNLYLFYLFVINYLTISRYFSNLYQL